MSIELMLNAANLSFLAGSRMHTLGSVSGRPDHKVRPSRVRVVVAAVEAAVGLALVIAL